MAQDSNTHTGDGHDQTYDWSTSEFAPDGTPRPAPETAAGAAGAFAGSEAAGKTQRAVETTAETLKDNYQFLEEIFEDQVDHALVQAMPAGQKKGFSAQLACNPATKELLRTNAAYKETSYYYCISALTPAPMMRPDMNGVERHVHRGNIPLYTRTATQFEAAVVLMLDDLGTKMDLAVAKKLLPPPTYSLETSPGNFQWGYKFETPVADRRVLGALAAAVIKNPDLNPPLVDPGMSTEVRICRLPFGANCKEAVVKANGGKPWPHVLHTYQPGLTYAPETLASALGIVLDEDTLNAADTGGTGSRSSVSVSEAIDHGDSIMLAFQSSGTLIGTSPNSQAGFIDVLCPWRHEHTDNADTGAGYNPTKQYFVCHHGHCKIGQDNLRDGMLWQWVCEGIEDDEGNTISPAPLTQQEITDCAQAGAHLAGFEAVSEAEEAVANALSVALADALGLDWEPGASAETSAEKPETEAEAETGDDTDPDAWSFGDPLPVRLPEIVDDLVPAYGVTFFGGQSGVGKTFTVVDLAVSVSAKLPFLGREIKEQCGVIYLAAEGEATLPERITACAKEHGVSPVGIEVLGNIGNLNNRINQNKMIVRIKKAAKRVKTRTGLRTGVVILDTLAASIPVKDENGPELGEAITKAKSLGRAIGAATVLIHHYGKDAASGLRGWSGAKADAESIIAILGDQDELRGTCTNRRVVHTKNRDGESGATWRFTLKSTKIEGREKPVGYFAVDGKERAAAASMSEEAERGQDAELGLLLMALKKSPTAKQSELGTLIGRDRSRVSRLLKELTNKGYIEKNVASGGYTLKRKAKDHLSEAAALARRQAKEAFEATGEAPPF